MRSLSWIQDRRIPQKKLRQNIPIRFMILHGSTILRQQEILRRPRHRWITYIRQMRMSIWMRRTGRSCGSLKKRCFRRLRSCRCITALLWANAIRPVTVKGSFVQSCIAGCVPLHGSIRSMKRCGWIRWSLTVRSRSFISRSIIMVAGI